MHFGWRVTANSLTCLRMSANSPSERVLVSWVISEYSGSQINYSIHSMAQRIKLLLLIPHLGGGGAEQVTAQLARHLNPQHFEIHLCLIGEDRPGTKSIPRWVHIHRLHRRRVRHAWLPLVQLIRAEKPDVILSGMAHLNFLILLLKPLLPRRTCILVRQNTTASSVAKTWLYRLAYRHLYRRAHTIVCQSSAMASDLAAAFALPAAKLKVAANPIDVKVIQAACAVCHRGTPPDSWPRLLTVGRLAPEKGIDLLLHVLQEVKQIHPQVHLQILGVGREESALRQLSIELNIADAVTFAGHHDNPPDFYTEATLFVLPSRYEGMPNALLEAAAAGLPLVATPCSAGLCELLQNAPGTWLANAISAESLAQTILAAIEALHTQPHRFDHTFLTPFETSTAVAAYASLIEEAARARP
jgi:glycosyltransferase involved in cell wall biosynthesis